jgi:hypothetical protein
MVEINRYNESLLDYKELHRLLSYDEETGIFRWKVQLSPSGLVGNVAGYKDTYIIISIRGKKYTAGRLAWLYVYGEWPELLIDHIDRNKHNNAIDNLREATNTQNLCNADRVINAKGYYFDNGRYKSKIKVNGRDITIGRFNTEEEAHTAYIQAKKQWCV